MADYINTEYVRLKNAPVTLQACPKCKEPFEPFLRGLVRSWWRGWFGMKASCVICHSCKEIVGYE